MIRSSSVLHLYLTRHAEAYKNLTKVHGGGDQRLTLGGEAQANSLGDYLRRSQGVDGGVHIVHQPEGRSEATARHIGAILATSTACCPDLLGVGLGVTEGLSDAEVAARYPDVAAGLVAWRTQQGSLGSRSEVPGSERMEDFATRVRRGLTLAIEQAKDCALVVIVGTTSTLNMMNHLLAYDGRFDRARYYFIDFPLGSIAGWRISSAVPTCFLPITTPPHQLGA